MPAAVGKRAARRQTTDRRTEDARALAATGRAEEKRGNLMLALVCLEQALSLLSGHDVTPLEADILRWTGTVRRELGHTDKADLLYQRSLKAAERTEHKTGQAHALNCLAIVAQRKGETSRAAGLYRRAARVASDAGQHRLSGMIEQNLGVLANIKGDLDSALVRYRISLRAFQKARDYEGVSWVLNNLGMLESDVGRYVDAERTFARGLAIARQRGDLYMEGLLEANRAEALIGQRRWLAAEAACRRAAEIAEERGDPLRQASALKFLAIVERERGAVLDAISLLEQIQTVAEKGRDVLLASEIVVEAGECWRRLGDLERARSCWHDAALRFRRLGAALDAATTEERLELLQRTA